jgi:hypothetical protein
LATKINVDMKEKGHISVLFGELELRFPFTIPIELLRLVRVNPKKVALTLQQCLACAVH